MSGTNGKLELPYPEFIARKSHLANGGGFKTTFMPEKAKDFQRYLIDWNLWNARSGCFADCGLGKGLIGLAWSENIVRHTNKRVLFVTPLAVSYQILIEAEKFGIEAKRSHKGELDSKTLISVTNYEQLHCFNPSDFVGIVGDEGSRIKNFNGKTRKAMTEFMKKIPYRLIATATAAPNDFIEFGTISEALGYTGFIDMLNKYFKNDKNNSAIGRHFGKKTEWRFKGHAKTAFWRFIASFARAGRKPSDFGDFSDNDFVLPPLIENEHFVEAKMLADGFLFDLPAVGLNDQREEQRRTIKERCEKAAEIVNSKPNEPSLCWVNLNPEGDYLTSIIKGAVQISGRDSDEQKEEKFIAFINGEITKLVSKLKVCGFGLNLQHCAHTTYFPWHSFEQKYQGIRRFWRFGQKRPVVVDTVLTEGQRMILANVRRKEIQADEMFTSLIMEMKNATREDKINEFIKREELPQWL